MRCRCDLLLTGAHLIPIRPARTSIVPGSVAIQSGKIVAVGPSSDVDSSFAPLKTIDCEGKALLPGFVNAHAHSVSGLLRGHGPALAMNCEERSLAEALDEASASVAIELAYLEFIRAGITAVGDMSPHAVAVAETFDRLGLKSIVSSYRYQSEARALEEASYLCARGFANVRVGIAINVTKSTFGVPEFDALEFAKANRLPLLIHLAPEGRGNHALDNPPASGFVEALPEGSLIIHAIAPLPGLRDDLAWVDTPSANARLRHRMPQPVAERPATISAGLGTDTVVLAGRHDMFEEMRVSVLFSRIGGPLPFSPWDALERATIGGATALGLEREIGTLEQGKRADLIVVDLNAVHFAPRSGDRTDARRLIHDIIFSASVSDVESVVLGGKLAMFERNIAGQDEQAILAAARSAARVVLDRAMAA